MPYSIESDPQESRSLAGQRPEVVTRLLAAVAEFQKQIPKVWRLEYPVRDPRKLPSGLRKQ